MHVFANFKRINELRLVVEARFLILLLDWLLITIQANKYGKMNSKLYICFWLNI